jgi:hypothetical protein
MKLLAIDPSIAKPASAFFWVHEDQIPRRIPSRDQTWTEAAVSFQSTHQIKTVVGDSSVARCAYIAKCIRGEVSFHGIDTVVIEVPPVGGSYRAGQARQRSKTDLKSADLDKLNRAIGAIAGAAATCGARVVELPAIDGVVERSRGIVAGALAQASRLDGSLARDLMQATLANEPLHGKKCRHRILRALLGATATELPAQEDARDAAWLGLQYLATEVWG